MISKSTFFAVLTGFVGAILIWIAAPGNNFLLANAFISDDFLPVGAVSFMLLITLVLNPLLQRFAPRCTFDFRRLALIFGIVLVASVTPGQGGLRHIFYPIGATPFFANEDIPTAEAYQVLNPPAALFPDRIAPDAPAPASEYFVDQLPRGESVPWSKWRGPLLAWGAFFGPYWLMLIALSVIVFPYWREVERQPFPLLDVQTALIERDQGGILPDIFRNRLFWIGFAVVFGLHLLSGLHQYFPTRCPEISLKLDLTQAFADHPLRYLPHYIKFNQVHFLFLGIAFFMPNRVGFSIWFLQIVYAVFIMTKSAYLPPYDGQMIVYQRTGAWIALPIGLLWLGRRHWAAMIRNLFHPARTDEQRRDKIALIALITGMLGVLAWLLWVRVPFWWALLLVALLFLFALGMARIVAETGIPLMAPDTHYIVNLANMVPVTWRTAAGMYFSGIVAIIAGHLNRVCATVMGCHAIGLDRKATPRRQLHIGGLLFAVLAASIVIGGAIQLVMSYNFPGSIDGRSSPLGYGGPWYFRGFAEPLLKNFVNGRVVEYSFNEGFHLLFGAGLTAFLHGMCQFSAKWPLHPVALLFTGNWYAHRVWFSVFIGWLIKVLVLRLGGAKLFRSWKNVFLGLIIGETCAVILWCAVAGILAATGQDYQVVSILPF